MNYIRIIWSDDVDVGFESWFQIVVDKIDFHFLEPILNIGDSLVGH